MIGECGGGACSGVWKWQQVSVPVFVPIPPPPPPPDRGSKRKRETDSNLLRPKALLCAATSTEWLPQGSSSTTTPEGATLALFLPVSKYPERARPRTPERSAVVLGEHVATTTLVPRSPAFSPPMWRPRPLYPSDAADELTRVDPLRPFLLHNT